MVTLKAVLPSGKKMMEGNIDGTLKQHIRALAQAVLQHLFYPVVLRHLGRRQRLLFTEQFVEKWSLRSIQDAVESALVRASLFGLLLTHSGVNGEGTTGRQGRSVSVSLPSLGSFSALHRSSSQSSQRLEANIQRSIAMLVQDERRVRLQVVGAGEVLLWGREPANAVLVLLSGSITEFRPEVVHDSILIAATAPPEVRDSSPKGEEEGGDAPLSELNSPPRPPRSRIVSKAARSTTPGPGYTRRGEPAFSLRHTLHTAPFVVGEAACMGGGGYGSSVVVESELALVAWISRVDYCSLVAESGLTEVQRALVYEGLRSREILLPYTLPMSVERLRLSPLFSNLRKEDLKELLGSLIPRVYPAGVQMSEGDHPKHIFFIRRGLVRREAEAKGYHDTAELHCDRPRTQALLVDGHSFGELPCAFHETTKETFIAVNNVDAFLLPYSVLEAMMQEKPEVRVELEAGARRLYEERVMASAGLKFTPTLVDPRIFVDGILPRDCGLLNVYKKVIMDQRLAPSSSPSSRRVTIMDGGAPLEGEKPTLMGGRVTAGMIDAAQQIPLLSTVAPPSFTVRCLSLWKCAKYNAGEVVVRRGEECNRIVFFYYGACGVVLDENMYRREGISKRSVLPIPKGQMIGFTCVRRHRWMRSVICLENNTEVWELKRSALVPLLQQFEVAEQVNLAVLQVLQPLYPIAPTHSVGSGRGSEQEQRMLVLDLQPLLRPMQNSLWGSQPLPNFHPVSLATHTVQYPVWKAGDFPLGQSGEAPGRSKSFSSRRMSRQVASSLMQSMNISAALEGFPQHVAVLAVARETTSTTARSAAADRATTSAGRGDECTAPVMFNATLRPEHAAEALKEIQKS